MPYSKPLCVDLFCGLGGFSEGPIAEGYECVGFDIERHVYGEHRYPAQLVLQDVLTLHGKQFKDAALIVASPPCQAYSYRAMPWSRAKALPPPDNSLFEACFRIQREACEAAGHHIPLVVENVRGAQKWVGRANWHFGSFYLWGDVPALMPMVKARAKVTTMGAGWYPPDHPKHVKGLAFNGHAERALKDEGVKFGDRNVGRASGEHRWNTGFNAPLEGQKWGDCNGKRFDERPKGNVAAHREGKVNRPDHTQVIDPERGTKGYAARLGDSQISRKHGSKSNARKFASAMIAKIPLVLSRHIAAVYKPDVPQERVG